MLSVVSLFVACAAMVVIGCAALQDVRERLIANRYSLFLFALAVAHHIVTADGPMAWLQLSGGALIVATTLFTLGFLLWRAGALGGGDVKLLVAAGFFVGVEGVTVLVAGTALAGGVLAIVQMLVQRLAPIAMLLVTGSGGVGRSDRNTSLPYGVAIATGFACAVVPSLPLLIG